MRRFIHNLITKSDDLRRLALMKNSWTEKTLNGIRLVFSPLLQANNVLHAFTTRVGGDSSDAPYASFNLGRGLNDETANMNALQNRRRLCEAFGLDFDNLYIPGQVHSKNVVTIADSPVKPDLSGVDGLITNRSDAALLLQFADCVPVIVADVETKVVGVFHAGWRGTAQSIVSHGIQLMEEQLGAKRRSMIAAVGPSIGSCCYPTGHDVVQAVSKAVRNADGLIALSGDQPRPDLKALNALQLLEAGITAVDVSDHCTACLPDLFYSYRLSGGLTGRQGALVTLQGPSVSTS